ncbi:MAG: DUF4115 domain-containing protein [Terriglobia bacterium]
MSLGADLKRERELRGISLQEISNATKISPRLLESLEADQFDNLPGGIFRKAFLRSYAKYLGMNEEQVIHEYTLAFESVVPAADEKQPAPRAKRDSNRSRFMLVTGFLVLLGGILAFLFYLKPLKLFSHKTEPPTIQVSTPNETAGAEHHPSTELHGVVPAKVEFPTGITPPPVASADAGGGVSPAANQPPSQAPGSNLQLKVLGELAKKPEPQSTLQGSPDQSVTESSNEMSLEATDPSWISVSSGENKIFAGMLQPKEIKKFPLQSPLRVVLGNAGGIKIMVNGQSLAPLGKPGERRTLDISTQNYKQFLPTTP